MKDNSTIATQNGNGHLHTDTSLTNAPFPDDELEFVVTSRELDSPAEASQPKSWLAQLQNLGVQKKATLLAIALGISPVLAVESISYLLSMSGHRLGLWTLLLETGVTAGAVAAIATALVAKALQPILDSTKAVKKLGQGELDTRVTVVGNDEVAILGANINQMADRMQGLLQQQEEAAGQELESQALLSQKQAEIADQERQRSQEIQRELMNLVGEVEGAASGDLTVRAQITVGEIGIVADFFNSIIENLKDIVVKVKQTSHDVNASVGENENAIVNLAEEAQRQAQKIKRSLTFVERMSQSGEEVAEKAQYTAEIVDSASQSAQKSGVAMDRTVDSINQLRDTIADTAKKVKRLGESSQQISKAVSLINQIALQTNLLAINASIEAARAGEEGRGFAVVAEEVGALASQSATATKEIEKIVETIQLETSSVVDAMETGTTQVVEGTQLIEETKKNLGEILEVSAQVDELVKEISAVTASQTQQSQFLIKSFQDIAQGSENSSQSSRDIANSLETTVSITQKLEESMEAFKVS